MTTASVTVYIATKNRAPLLTRALSSIQSQRFSDWQCIVVDDGSTDNTPATLRAFTADARIQYVRWDISHGACAARNEAIRRATTPYVTGLDDDDMFLPDRLLNLLRDIGEHPLVGSRDLTVRRGKASVTNRPNMVRLKDIVLRNVVGNQLMMRRSDVLAAGGYDESLPASQDHDLWVRMIGSCGPAKIQRSLGQIIFEDAVPDRITANTEKRISGMKTFLEKHQHRMSDLSRRSHRCRIRRLEGLPNSVGDILLSTDLSLEGLKEFRRGLASRLSIGRA